MDFQDFVQLFSTLENLYNMYKVLELNDVMDRIDKALGALSNVVRNEICSLDVNELYAKASDAISSDKLPYGFDVLGFVKALTSELIALKSACEKV